MTKQSIEVISEKLRRDIILGTLKSGEHIIEKKIAKRLNYSRIPVREALKILEGEGFVEKFPNKGNFVKKLTSEYVDELAILYETLVPILLKDAIPHYTKRTYNNAEKILIKMRKSNDSVEIGYLIWDFKEQLFKQTKYKFILSIIENVYKQSLRLISILIENMNQKSFNISIYEKILELCKQKKGDEAVNLFMEFFNIEKNLLT